jgi:hypothetical protein
MEDACVALVAIVALPLATLVADLFGLCMGLGWGHYSKRRKAMRAKEKVQTND